MFIFNFTFGFNHVLVDFCVMFIICYAAYIVMLTDKKLDAVITKRAPMYLVFFAFHHFSCYIRIRKSLASYCDGVYDTLFDVFVAPELESVFLGINSAEILFSVAVYAVSRADNGGFGFKSVAADFLEIEMQISVVRYSPVGMRQS